MGLQLIACVKRTPASTSVALDASGAVKTDGVQHGINPFDEYAVEEAVRLKERIPGAKVTVVTAGGAESEEVLRAALAVGADEAVLLADPAFDGSDTLGTSHILAKAIARIAAGSPAVALFGKQTNDGESGHITASVAAWLGWPGALSVRKVAKACESELVVERLMEDGVDTLKLRLPAVLGVTKEINEPRLPSLKGKMAAKKAAVARWGAADIGADAALIGKANAPTEVLAQAAVSGRPAGTVIGGATAEEKAKNLVARLKEAKLL